MLLVLATAGCGQTSSLQRARGWERLRTPSSRRTGKEAQQHAVVAAAQPQPSCDNVKIKAYNHQVCCQGVQEIFTPATVEELRDKVRSSNGKLRVVGNSHTSNEQICTDGTGISMANLNQIHGLRRYHGVEYVDVDPGVRLSELNRWLYDHGRSIGYTTIGFRGITIGGGIATGAHGSSLKNASVLSSRVEYVEVMDAAGETRAYHRPSPPPVAVRAVAPRIGQLTSAAPTVPVVVAALTQPGVAAPRAEPAPAAGAAAAASGDALDEDHFRALAASVGMLGIVTRIGLRVEPRFNLDVTADFHQARVLWTEGVEKLVGDCDWGQLVWLPRASRVMRVCGMHTLAEPQPAASNSLLAPHVDAGAIGAFKELMEDTIANGAWLCTIERERWGQLKMYPPFVHDCCCKTKYAAHVIGPGDLMMSSEMTEHQRELAEIDYELAIPLDEVPAALTEVYRAAKDQRLCMPLIGVFLRFSPVDRSTLVAHSVSDAGWFKNQKVMFLEFVVYVLHEPETAEEREQQERDYYAKYRQLAIDLVQKHHARPHWGKNQIPVFQVHKEEDRLYQARLREFHCWVRKADPEDRFGNEFTRIVGLTAPARQRPDDETLEDCLRDATRARAAAEAAFQR